MTAWLDDSMSKAQRQNRLLLEDPGMENDRYERRAPNVVGGRYIAPVRPGPGLIEEESERATGNDIAYSLGMPGLTKMQDAKKAASARRIYGNLMRSKAAANPWTRRGQQTRDNVRTMFGEPTAKQESAVSWFKKLFGTKPGNFRAKERADWAERDFGDRWANRRGAQKLSWMERLFGARKPKGSERTPVENRAFAAQRGGASWADALAPLHADGSAKFEDWKDKKSSASAQESGLQPDETPSQTQPNQLLAEMSKPAEHDSGLSDTKSDVQVKMPDNNMYADYMTEDDNSIDNDSGDIDDQPVLQDYVRRMFQ